jgi:hypothetical protein
MPPPADRTCEPMTAGSRRNGPQRGKFNAASSLARVKLTYETTYSVYT